MARRLLRTVRLLALSLGGMVLLLLTVHSSVASLHRANGSSDAPTIADGEVFLVNRIAYDVRLPLVGTAVVTHGDPRRGDAGVRPGATQRSPGSRDAWKARRRRSMRPLLGAPSSCASARRCSFRVTTGHECRSGTLKR